MSFPNETIRVWIEGESSRPGAMHFKILGNCSQEVFKQAVEKFYAENSNYIVCADANAYCFSGHWQVIFQIKDEYDEKFTNCIGPLLIDATENRVDYKNGSKIAIDMPKNCKVRFHAFE